MRCPIDGSDLVISERQGVEIDYCPKCRGIWLDRGELDKIIEKAAADVPDAAPQAAPPQQGYAPGDGQGHYGHKKRKHWLEDLFD
jgi:uncharacterized protein